MNLILNHSPEVIETSQQTITVSELLKIKNFTFRMLVIKINDEVVKKDNYSTSTIKDGDNVQVIHLISGG
ncbi:MAG: sulfur carrier protein ThiS [Bacteroidales bacterium]|jgi:thiamine biosynthesis protein ThiS|nr:sulfur carrier protein ThiS [Bacteroidales bacterium]